MPSLLPLTPRAKHAVETANKIAVADGRKYICTNDLFLALLADNQLGIHSILEECGLAPKGFRKNVLKFLKSQRCEVQPDLSARPLSKD